MRLSSLYFYAFRSYTSAGKPCRCQLFCNAGIDHKLVPRPRLAALFTTHKWGLRDSVVIHGYCGLFQYKDAVLSVWGFHGLTTVSSLYGNSSTLKDGLYIETRPLCHQNYFATIVSVGTINNMQHTPYLKQNYYRYIAMSPASSRRGPPPGSPSPCMCDDVVCLQCFTCKRWRHSNRVFYSLRNEIPMLCTEASWYVD